MPRIKMLEKMSAYKVTYLADRPGEIGARLYAKKVFAGNERDAIIAFNGWFDSCKAFPEGSSCDIQKVELIQSEGAAYDEYVDAVAASLEDDFEYSPVTALEFARDDFKDITKAFYSATKDPKEAAKEIDAKYMGGNEGRKKAEDHEGWDGWEEVEGLEDTIEGIENLAYELRNCIRGAKTRCKDWKSLARYIKGLASNLDDAAELMAYKTDSDDDDDESANESKKKKKNPSKDFSSTVEEDEDGRKKSH